MSDWLNPIFYLPGIGSIIIAIFLFYKDKIFFFFKGATTPTPILDHYSSDLTKLAYEGELDPVIGREEEIIRVIQILSRRTQNNPLLVGKAGVGKTSITEGLAYRIANNKVPKNLQGKRVLVLNLSDLMSGTRHQGNFERRVKDITKEIVAARRSIILFIDEFHILAGLGKAVEGVTAKDILKPTLARGDLQMIGATTPEEFKEYIKQDKSLIRRLEPVFIDEPSITDTVLMLKGTKNQYEHYHQIIIPDEILDNIVKLSNKCFTERYFPDKAIDLLDETAAWVKMKNVVGKIKPVMTINDVKKVTKQITRK